MKFPTQSHTPTSPSSPPPTVATVHPDSPAPSIPSSPLASFIPNFFRRPSQPTRPSSALRSRSSSATTSRTTSSASSPRVSGEAFGLLDDDPFACPWTGSQLPLPDYLLPTSPPTSPTKDYFGVDPRMGQTQSVHQFPRLNRTSEDGNAEPNILPLHRRDRSFTVLKQHPRNQTWQSDKPAFRNRPSLPPLSILAQQHVFVVAPKSSRARQFPSEPWDQDASELLPLSQIKVVTPPATPEAPYDLPKGATRPTSVDAEKALLISALPAHPSPIAELEEESDTESLPPSPPPETAKEYAEAEEQTAPRSPSPEDANDEVTLNVDSPRGSCETSKPFRAVQEITTAEVPAVDGEASPSGSADVTVAISVIENFHLKVPFPQAERSPSSQFDTSPAPSSCLLPSTPILPELSSRTSESDSAESTDAECKTDDDPLETYSAFWRSQQELETSFRSPTIRRNTASCDDFFAHFCDPRNMAAKDGSMFPYPPVRPGRAISFTSGQPSPFNRMLMASNGYSGSGFQYSRQANARGGVGRSGGSGRRDGERDGFDRRSNGSSGAGGSGRDGRDGDGGRRNFLRGSSAEDDSASEDDEDDTAKYGEPEPESRASRESHRSDTLRVPRPSRRSTSSRGSGASPPPVPPLPERYKSVSPVPNFSPKASPAHSRSSSTANGTLAAMPRPPSNMAVSPRMSTVSKTMPRRTSSRSSSESRNSRNSDSDDVPLARRLPGALTAQKSIRRQAREERSQRSTMAGSVALSRKPSSGAGLAGASTPSSALADELTSKLLQVQQKAQAEERGRLSATGTSEPRRSQSQHRSRPIPSPGLSRTEEQLQAFQLPASGQATSLRPAPSLRRQALDDGTLSRSATRTRQQSLGPRNERPGHLDVHPHPLSGNPSPRVASTPRSPDSDAITSPRSPPLASVGLVPHSPFPMSRGSSSQSQAPLEAQRNTRSRAMTITPDVGTVKPHDADTLRRAKTIRDDGGARVPKSPMPHMTTKQVEQPSRPSLSRGVTDARTEDIHQQRIFIGDAQRFVDLEITSASTAQDVIEIVMGQGEIQGRDWMLWEVARQVGMERPIRDYERLSDVCAAWNKETMVNALMLRQTPLASLLAPQNIPNSSPVYGGFVHWEVKRGKWSKRWLSLREHSLFISKKENSKDEAFLCSLSSFDAYLVKHSHKAPKSFVFALRSTENITMFENPLDWVHNFSCESDEGNTWFEKLLIARSYVIHRERNVLRSQPILGRSNTRKGPPRPLITDTSPSLPPLPFQAATPSPAPGLFAGGSLLARSAAYY
ncbi:hypothetical protein FRB99_001476 [Tulasnella sp. 403]|nr:hypothetical protein FRB99_001476 [Tulasnella sp. 403]